MSLRAAFARCGGSVWTTALVCLGVFGLSMMQAAGEDVTLATYYPSPRGVYEEVRANRFVALDGGTSYGLDTREGTVELSQVILVDSDSRRRYSMSIRDGKLVVVDLQSSRGFILMDMAQLKGS